jgi:thymidylate kinase
MTAMRRRLFRNQLRRQPWALCRQAARDGWRLSRRWLRPPGLHIAILGPDGCGKSTVHLGLTEALRFTYPPGKGLLLHWKPVVFGRSHRQVTEVVTDPHGRPPRNPLASLAYFAFHWLEFLLGSLTLIHPVKFRNGLVISDRCYYDFFVDPKRFRLNLPRWVLRLGGGLLPQPDLVFLLDAPTEVLQSRKQEVSPEETRRQRDAFLAVVKALPNGHVLDATQSPEQIIADTVRIILDHLSHRMAHSA